MRQTLTFLIILILCSCEQQNKQPKTTPADVSIDSGVIPPVIDEKVGYEKTDSTILHWKKFQDSIRNEILKGKENKFLKESFLQEMYIRNVISLSKDSLFVDIPFNLHGPDCGAPDCYSTDVSFSFKFEDSLIFPKRLGILEHEHGCIDKETKLSGSFDLVEQTGRHVIYHSIKHKRTLVLFSSVEESGTTAYYFTNVMRGRINGNNVNKIIYDYNEDNKNSIYPFTSWILTTKEYENFLQ